MRPTTTPTGRTAPSIRQHPSSPSQQRLLTSTPSASTAATGSAASSTNTPSPHDADGVFGTHSLGVGLPAAFACIPAASCLNTRREPKNGLLVVYRLWCSLSSFGVRVGGWLRLVERVVVGKLDAHC